MLISVAHKLRQNHLKAYYTHSHITNLMMMMRMSDGDDAELRPTSGNPTPSPHLCCARVRFCTQAYRINCHLSDQDFYPQQICNKTRSVVLSVNVNVQLFCWGPYYIHRQRFRQRRQCHANVGAWKTKAWCHSLLRTKKLTTIRFYWAFPSAEIPCRCRRRFVRMNGHRRWHAHTPLT